MLSDEEKQAIQYLNKYCDTDLFYEQRHYNYIKMIIRLVEKQSKEIEELKEDNKTLKNLQNDTNRLYIEMIERKNYFERELQKLEDKIKAKIEEYEQDVKDFEEYWSKDPRKFKKEKSVDYYKLEALKELLEKE